LNPLTNANESKNTDDDVTEGGLLDRTMSKSIMNQSNGSEIVLSGRDLDLKKKPQSYKSIIEEEEGENLDDKSDQE